MSVNLYDEALLNKLRNWTKDTSFNIYGPSDFKEVIQTNADQNNDDALKLPIICLRRTNGFTLLQTSKRPLSFDGLTLEANTKLAKQLNAIPISIPYQLDIYTRYLKEADEYSRNFIFNIINFPKLEINIPYNDENYIHHCNIRLQESIDDNSDIPERLIKGQFTRITMRIDIDDAYLFDVRYRDVYDLKITSDLSDNNIKDDFKDTKLV